MEREKVANSLGSLGLSKMEAEVYLHVSSNPETTAGQVTKELRIARSKTYEALNKLCSMGLIARISREDVGRYYSSGSSMLKGMYKKQTDNASVVVEYIKKLDVIAPSVIKIRVVEGTSDYKKLKEGFLSEMVGDEEILIIGSPAKMGRGLVEYFGKFHQKRIARGTKLRIIYNADVSKKRLARAMEWKNTKMRCLPKNNSPAWIEIYGDRVLIPLASDKLITIAITDKTISTSFRNYFELLWESTKKPKKEKASKQSP